MKTIFVEFDENADVYKFCVVSEFETYKFARARDCGTSDDTSVLNVGAPDPLWGPIKTADWDVDEAPVPPDATASGVPSASVSIEAPCETVRPVPVVASPRTPTYPSGLMTMASDV